MASVHWSRGVWACVTLSLFIGAGCSKPQPTGGAGGSPAVPAAGPTTTVTPAPTPPPAIPATANADDVKAARARIAELGSKAKAVPPEGDLLSEILIGDGSNVTAEDLTLFGKLSDLKKLEIKDCRTLNDEMASQLSGLKGLTSLALTNTIINDVTVELIVKSFPDLVELDLSSNTNMTSSVVKIVSALSHLQRLTLVQTKVNDIGAGNLAKLKELEALDLRGNMQAGDSTLEVIADLPKLRGLKHRSSSVTDSGLESLSHNPTLSALLIQDFKITDESGLHLAKCKNLTQLEVFRCQGFGTEGVLALKGMKLTRLRLRDLSSVDNRAMEVFDHLPQLRRLELHEMNSISDEGLKHLAALPSLEVLDIWSMPKLTDATIDVILALPKLKELSLRATGITPEGAKKLEARKWTKLDFGTGDAGEAAAP